MHFRSLGLLPLLFLTFGLVLAAPRGASLDTTHVIHEKRDYVPQGWAKRSRVPEGLRIPVRIAMKQGGLDSLDEHLMRVSDPDSDHFGRVSGRPRALSQSAIYSSVDFTALLLSSIGLHRKSLPHSLHLKRLSM